MGEINTGANLMLASQHKNLQQRMNLKVKWFDIWCEFWYATEI